MGVDAKVQFPLDKQTSHLLRLEQVAPFVYPRPL